MINHIGLEIRKSEFIPFAVVSLILAFGIYFLLRRYWKARSLRLSLVIVGFFWVLYGYIFLKHITFVRIWAIIDAPYNPYALQNFLSYDVLLILAILLTGASLVVYSSILLMNPTRTPLKWFVKGVLCFLILTGCLTSTNLFIYIYYSIARYGSFELFCQRYAGLGLIYWLYVLLEYLAPLFVLYTGFCFLELLRRMGNLRAKYAGIHYGRSKMALLPIAALMWISAGIVNFVCTIIPVLEKRAFYGGGGPIVERAFVRAIDLGGHQLFFVLIGLSLFIIWLWGLKGEDG